MDELTERGLFDGPKLLRGLLQEYPFGLGIPIRLDHESIVYRYPINCKAEDPRQIKTTLGGPIADRMAGGLASMPGRPTIRLPFVMPARSARDFWHRLPKRPVWIPKISEFRARARPSRRVST